MTESRWIAVYTGSSRERYVRHPGWRKWRGMYGNRRVERTFWPVLTDNPDEAFRFTGPADVKRRLRIWAGGHDRHGWPSHIEARKASDQQKHPSNG
jgi:hypothetical protein